MLFADNSFEVCHLTFTKHQVNTLCYRSWQIYVQRKRGKQFSQDLGLTETGDRRPQLTFTLNSPALISSAGSHGFPEGFFESLK